MVKMNLPVRFQDFSELHAFSVVWKEILQKTTDEKSIDYLLVSNNTQGFSSERKSE